MLRTKLTLSTLAATIVLAGCSTQMTQPTQKDVSATKVEAVKVDSTVFDLGAKNGSSFKIKVGVNGEKSPFGIKAINGGVFTPTPAELATRIGTKLVIKLHKYDNTSAYSLDAPMDRFNIPGLPINQKIEFTGPFTGGLAFPLGITFRGLQPDRDYFVSARLYDAPVTFITGDVILNFTNSDGTLVKSGGTNTVPLSSFMFELNDLLDIGGTVYRVSNLAPLRVVVDSTGLAPANATAMDLMSYRRDIVGIGNEGDASASNKGMAINGASVGGGTAASGAAGLDEESVKVMHDGFTSVINDIVTTNTLDLKIQLRNSVNPEVTGTVSVAIGNAAAASESITNP